MEPVKNQTVSSEKGQGFMPGVILGLALGAACFWLTIIIVKTISH